MKEFDQFLQNKRINSEHTRRSYRTCITKLLNYYHIEDLGDWNSLKLADFEEWLSSMDIKNSSYNQHLRSLQSFSTWLEEHELCGHNYPKKIHFAKESASTGDLEYDRKRKSKEQTFLTSDELFAILKQAKNIDKKLRVALMADMGLRRSEIVNLRKDDVRDNMLTIRGKGGTFEELEMTPMVKYLVDEYLKNRKDDSEYLIVSLVGKHQVKNAGSSYGMIKSLARKAGIDPEKVSLLTPHSLRRSMICNAILAGENFYTIKTMSRHKQITTTERYASALKNVAANKVFANKPMPDMSVLQGRI